MNQTTTETHRRYRTPFWAQVHFGPTCHEWMGHRHRKGHGMRYHDGKMRYAHRVAWELAHGPIPPGMCVCHRCDNPRCVRVEHLFLGTVADNNRDMFSKGRDMAWAVNGLKTHCPLGHAYAGDNLYVHGGRRHCKTCVRAAKVTWRASRRAAGMVAS